jgi:2-haloacid dehalogenase
VTATGPQVQTLIFDVLGTVVDEDGSLAADFAAVEAESGLPPEGGPELARSWSRRLGELLEPITAGTSPWRPASELSREALSQARAEAGIRLDDAAFDELARAGHRLRAWPDSPSALRALSERYLLVALSNGSMAQLADLTRRNRLTWHCVLSGELAHAYKPDPAVYRFALELLGLDPARTLMVAAHPWDLRAAAAHGIGTAYIARPGAEAPGPDDRFDYQAADLAELASLLGAGPGRRTHELTG